MIYLDHNSTSPIDPRVAEAIHRVQVSRLANPASQHRLGQLARHQLESTRSRVAALLGATISGLATDRLIFTSGGTEANNFAIFGLAGTDPNRQVLVSGLEHPSVRGAAEQLAIRGHRVRTIPANRAGLCDLVALEKMLDESPTALVSVMLANNETGVLQPLPEVVRLCRQHQALIHTDATQAIGKVPIDFSQLAVDAMTIAAHKFCGPRGIGGLLVRSGVQLQPILFGGFQQHGWRPGTEDVALPVGLCTALELCLENLESARQRMSQLVGELTERLKQLIEAPMVVIGENSPRLPNTLCVSFPGVDRQSILLAADFAGLAISTGSACASGSSEPSPALQAMGLDVEVIASSIRLSLGFETTADEVREAALRLAKIMENLRRKN